MRALGGAHLAAVEKAIFKPFTEATGIQVVPVPSVAAQVLAMVQAGRAQLDVIDVGEVSTMFLEKNGALEPIPYDRFKLTNPQDIDTAMRRPRMVGNVYAATVLVYNPQVFKTRHTPPVVGRVLERREVPGTPDAGRCQDRLGRRAGVRAAGGRRAHEQAISHRHGSGVQVARPR